jgi:hypothetical protein
MGNKYLYAFQKVGAFRTVIIISVIAVVFCLVLVRLCQWQGAAIRDLQVKQAVIAQIPALQAKLVQKKGPIVYSLSLSGIIMDKAQPMAVINDTVLKVGDTIEGKRVMSITDNKVKVCNIAMSDKCAVLVLEQ